MKSLPTFILFLFIMTGSFQASAGESGEELYAIGAQAYDGGNYREARIRWHAAAGLGHPDAMTSLADLMMRGQGGPMDQVNAVALYREAARLGDATASLAIAELALGNPEDPVRNYLAAYVWFSISANQGNDWAKQKVAEVRKQLSESEHAMADRLIRKNTHLKF